MSELKPLIDAGAFWVTADAGLRIFWSIFGAAMIVSAIGCAVPIGLRLFGKWKREPKP